MEGNSEVREPKTREPRTQEKIKDMIQERLRPENQNLSSSEKGWVGRIKDRFNSVLNREKSGGVEILIDFNLGKHKSAEDVRGMKEKLQNADVYVPENFGWTPEYLETLRKLSSGEMAPEIALVEWGQNVPSYDRDEEFFKIIYNSKKPIAMIDVPESDPLFARGNELRLPKIQFGTKFNQPLETFREYFRSLANLEKEREVYMLEHLQPQIQELTNTNQELKRKDKIKVLIDIGAANTSLHHNLKDDHQATREFSIMPMLFLYREEMMRRFIFGKPVEDELVGRAVTEYLLSKASKKLFHTDNPNEDALSARRLISRFSFDEMKEMFEGSRNVDEWTNSFIQRSVEAQKMAAAAK